MWRGPTVSAQSSAICDSASVVFMFYNCENLFDTINDHRKDDEEFLSGGTRGWNYNKYLRKLNALAKVIMSAGTWEPPALIGLCEVENEDVINDLLTLTPLRNFNYDFIYAESEDRRGIDLCLLYRIDIAFESDSRSITPILPFGDSLFLSRPVLYSKMIIYNQTLHLFINHWPSRRGGVLNGQPLRMALAQCIIEFADSIRQSEVETSAIVIAGDLNCNPGDIEISGIERSGFVNLASHAAADGKGTYRYRGTWNMFDQILVSEEMTEGNSSAMASGFSIHSPEILLTNDPVWPGKKPFPTYDNYRYAGGFSDHLPVMVTLTFLQDRNFH
jgi:hypothetical protein